MSYFKFNAWREGKSDWIHRQLLKGRAPFGWSPPKMDLRRLQEKKKFNKAEKECWSKGQFLINRIEIGDRLIIQTESPLRRFLIVEVTGPYGFLGSEDDFNHYLECKAITENYIAIDAEFIPAWVRHDLRKRGQYYQIYREETIRHFDSLIKQELWKKPEAKKKRTIGLEKKRMKMDVLEKIIPIISTRWPAKQFETFGKELIKIIPGVEVVPGSTDTHEGWDFLVNVWDPLSGEFLHEDVPVQCKNYRDEVDIDKPIDDLQRSLRNSESTIAYLFILGNLTDAFNQKLDEAENALKSDLGRDVKFRTIGQNEIAKLYMKYMTS